MPILRASLLVGLVVLAAALVVSVLYAVATRRLKAMTSLMQDGQHGAVLAHREPPRPYRVVGDRVRATSAVLTGRFATALTLLETRTRVARAAELLDDTDRVLRGASLVGLGRHAEAAQVLGSDPAEPHARHLRAQVATETGDDEHALRLLTDPHADALAEAGRLRLLGDLHIRRGRLAEGEPLVREALALYRSSGVPAWGVDAGYCQCTLGQAALARRDAPAALAHLGTATQLLSVRPDNAPGLAWLAALLAQARAMSGDADGALGAIASARAWSEETGSPALGALVDQAAGLVDLELGRAEPAASHLRSARTQHEALGEWPAVAVDDEALARLGRPEGGSR